MLLPLDDAGKIPLIRSTYEHVRKSKYSTYENTIIATPDEEIRQVAQAFGSKVCMTSFDCTAGSDRVAEAAVNLKVEADVIVNVQGDEPFIDPENIDAAIDGLLKNNWAHASTCAVKVEGSPDPDQSKVKVVVSTRGAALYFSRACIPHKGTSWHRHMGLYVYRPDVLQKYTKLPPSQLEETESLEQLRLLENDYQMLVVNVARCGFGGVDIPADLERAKAHFQQLKQAGNAK